MVRQVIHLLFYIVKLSRLSNANDLCKAVKPNDSSHNEVEVLAFGLPDLSCCHTANTSSMSPQIPASSSSGEHQSIETSNKLT